MRREREHRETYAVEAVVVADVVEITSPGVVMGWQRQAMRK
jgi:hypothetical protein